MHPLMQRSGKLSIRDQDVELFDAGHPRQEIPVGGGEPVDVDRPVQHRDDDVTIRPKRRLPDDRAPQPVFVRPVWGASLVEVAKNRGQESRLLDELTCAAIVRSPQKLMDSRKPVGVALYLSRATFTSSRVSAR